MSDIQCLNTKKASVMSRKGNCLDYSVMENFFGFLKTEMFYGHAFKLIEYFIFEIEKYINCLHIHSILHFFVS